MIKILKTIQQSLIVLFTFPWIGLFKYKSNKSDIIILIFPDFPRDILVYIYSDAMINDLALIKSFIKLKKPFKLLFSKNKALQLQNKRVFFNMNNRFRSSNNENYSEALISFAELINKKNRSYPSLEEVKYWENKAFMHEQFKKLNINEPMSKTLNLKSISSKDYEEFKFPFLIKEVHSAGSLGVHLIKNEEDIKTVLNKLKDENNFVIFQKLLKMDRDLRVIVIGNKIVLHYWRINKSSEWKPTSTKHGSDVDFEFFPEHWKQHCIDMVQKLGLRTGAFDLVWEENDFSVLPFVLEVSPSYQPNPIPPYNLNKSYGEWKSGFQIANGYPQRFVSIVNKLKLELVKTYFK